MDHNCKHCRIMTTVLGALATLFIIIAAISTFFAESETERNLWLILIHVIFVVLAIPFLLHSTREAKQIPTWFYRVISIEAIMNSIFLILTQNVVSTGKGPFYLFAVFELLPIILLQQNRFKLVKRKYILTA